MKFHITNLYNFNTNDELVVKQHHLTSIARSLGFLEMGLFAYPVETDTESELHKRIDGILSALERDDVVFVQLPTTNGYAYDYLLLNKIKVYPNTKLILVLHDTQILSDTADQETKAKYVSLYQIADAVIAPSVIESNFLKKNGVTTHHLLNDVSISNIVTESQGQTFSNDYVSLCKNNFYTKKLFLDCIDTVFSQKRQNALASVQTTDDEIHIGFGLHDKTGNYSAWVGITMQSIIEHTASNICFHILHDETLNDLNRNRLIQVAVNGGHRLLFHPLDKSLFSDVEDLMSIYTIGAMFRVMLPDIFPELSKIIYLDADLFVNRDIRELWDTDISQYTLAAVPDADVVNGLVCPHVVKRKEVPAYRYFNSGVLYMNLNKIREQGNMKTQILQFLSHTNENHLPDQDALNFIYNETTLLLDESWNHFIKNVRRNNELKAEPKIYHYVGTLCILYYLTEVEQLYFETICRTPWGYENSKAILNHTLVRITDRARYFEQLAIQFSESNKKIIYYGEETYAMQTLIQLLPVKENTYRVLTENETKPNGYLPCKKFSALKKEKKGTFIVFTLPDADNGQALHKLEQIGLENGIDFFVIPRLVPPHKGGYL